MDDQVMKAYKAILTQLQGLTDEQQHKVVKSLAELIDPQTEPS